MTSVLRAVNRAATSRRVTVTALAVGVISVAVVNRDFITRSDVATGDEKNVVVSDTHEGVGFARMIDVGGRVAADAAVQTPIRINRADTQMPSPARTDDGFVVGDYFARVLRDFMTAREILNCETSFALDGGRTHFQTFNEFEFHKAVGREQ